MSGMGQKMQENSIVGGIWKGACRSARTVDNQSFKSIFQALIPVPMSVFELDGWSIDPTAVLEDVELIPGISLGDILAEELSADVSFGSLVIIRNQTSLPDLSRAVGVAVGEVLLSVIERGVFPLADEDHVLFVVGRAYHQAAQSPELAQLGLVPESFRAGLSAVLAQYWSLVSDGVDIFSHDLCPSILPIQVRDCAGSNSVGPSLAAMTDFETKPTFNQWTLRLEALVGRRREHYARPVLDGNVGIS